MQGKYFLDTNIFIYTFDPTNKSKQKKSLDMVDAALTDHKGIISYQVIQEFLNVATKKFAVPLTASDCKLYLKQVLSPLCAVYPSSALYAQALDLKENHQFSFYDSLILAAALSTNCKILYSEDLQDGRKIDGLAIKNPFSF